MTRWALRARAMVALGVPTCRLLPWWHLVAGALVAVGPLWLALRPPAMGVGGTVEMLRFSAVPLAVALAFVLDDPSLATTSGAPLPVAARRVVRLAVIVPSWAAAWATLLVVADATVADRTLPVLALSLEFATLGLVTLAGAVVGRRRAAAGSGGLAAAPATLILVFVLYALIPDRWAFFVPYPDPGLPEAVAHWDGAHRRWAALAAVAALVAVWSSRDASRRDLAIGTWWHARRQVGRPREAENRFGVSARQSVTTSRPE